MVGVLARKLPGPFSDYTGSWWRPHRGDASLRAALAADLRRNRACQRSRVQQRRGYAPGRGRFRPCPVRDRGAAQSTKFSLARGVLCSSAPAGLFPCCAGAN
eukprot:SAG11_NODE_1154_length_5662_cov_3.473665_7_plen_102_part_00